MIPIKQRIISSVETCPICLSEEIPWRHIFEIESSVCKSCSEIFYKSDKVLILFIGRIVSSKNKLLEFLKNELCYVKNFTAKKITKSVFKRFQEVLKQTGDMDK